VTGIALLLNDKLNKKYQIKLNSLYILAVILAGIYVMTQELNFYNLRGDNTVDKNDLLYSFMGLVIGYRIVIFKKPRIYNE